MGTFIETRFLTDLAPGTTVGPQWQTNVVVLDSGIEQRKRRRAFPRHRAQVSRDCRDYDQLHTLKSIHMVAGGQETGFRVKDPGDFKSSIPSATPAFDDMVIGTGDGVLAAFQLIKIYTFGASTRDRNIYKPVTGTVLIGADLGSGFAVQPTGWTVDTTTGVVTFSPTVPVSGNVTAGFEFDIPMRFADDFLATTFDSSELGSNAIELIEIVIQPTL